MHTQKATPSMQAKGIVHGILALSDDCDLPNGGEIRGKAGCGYTWNASDTVQWKCNGGGFGVFFLAKQNESNTAMFIECG